MSIQYITGDIREPIGDGNKLIIHCCNDIGLMGAGVALALSNKWPCIKTEYQKWFRGTSKTTADRFDLGNVQFIQVEKDVWVANMIAQHDVRRNTSGIPPIRYFALEQCLAKVADKAKELNATIHGPKLGAGLAGGDWKTIEKSLIYIFKDIVNVTIYLFEPTSTVIDSVVQPPFPGRVLGGRGRCEHCGKTVNNVAYHEDNACDCRPNNKE